MSDENASDPKDLTLKEEAIEVLTEWQDQLQRANDTEPSEAISSELYQVSSVLANLRLI